MKGIHSWLEVLDRNGSEDVWRWWLLVTSGGYVWCHFPWGIKNIHDLMVISAVRAGQKNLTCSDFSGPEAVAVATILSTVTRCNCRMSLEKKIRRPTNFGSAKTSASRPPKTVPPGGNDSFRSSIIHKKDLTGFINRDSNYYSYTCYTCLIIYNHTHVYVCVLCKIHVIYMICL